MSAFISRYLIQIKRIAAHVNIRVVHGWVYYTPPQQHYRPIFYGLVFVHMNNKLAIRPQHKPTSPEQSNYSNGNNVEK